MKKWVVANNYYFYVAGLIIYLVGLNFLAQSFKFENIVVASVIFVLFNVITLSIISWFYFKETLSLYQISGIILGIFAVIILEIAHK